MRNLNKDQLHKRLEAEEAAWETEGEDFEGLDDLTCLDMDPEVADLTNRMAEQQTAKTNKFLYNGAINCRRSPTINCGRSPFCSPSGRIRPSQKKQDLRNVSQNNS